MSAFRGKKGMSRVVSKDLEMEDHASDVLSFNNSDGMKSPATKNNARFNRIGSVDAEDDHEQQQQQQKVKKSKKKQSPSKPQQQSEQQQQQQQKIKEEASPTNEAEVVSPNEKKAKATESSKKKKQSPSKKLYSLPSDDENQSPDGQSPKANNPEEGNSKLKSSNQENDRSKHLNQKRFSAFAGMLRMKPNLSTVAPEQDDIMASPVASPRAAEAQKIQDMRNKTKKTEKQAEEEEHLSDDVEEFNVNGKGAKKDKTTPPTRGISKSLFISPKEKTEKLQNAKAQVEEKEEQVDLGGAALEDESEEVDALKYAKSGTAVCLKGKAPWRFCLLSNDQKTITWLEKKKTLEQSTINVQEIEDVEELDSNGLKLKLSDINGGSKGSKELVIGFLNASDRKIWRAALIALIEAGEESGKKNAKKAKKKMVNVTKSDENAGLKSLSKAYSLNSKDDVEKVVGWLDSLKKDINKLMQKIEEKSLPMFAELEQCVQDKVEAVLKMARECQDEKDKAQLKKRMKQLENGLVMLSSVWKECLEEASSIQVKQ